MGCLAECLEFLGGPAVRQLLPQLLPVFLTAAADTESEDVQSNAVFGLGELAVSGGTEGGPDAAPQLPAAAAVCRIRGFIRSSGIAVSSE